jgi:hypothetical protein
MVEKSAACNTYLVDGDISEGQKETRQAKPYDSAAHSHTCDTGHIHTYDTTAHSHPTQQRTVIPHSSAQPYHTAAHSHTTQQRTITRHGSSQPYHTAAHIHPTQQRTGHTTQQLTAIRRSSAQPYDTSDRSPQPCHTAAGSHATRLVACFWCGFWCGLLLDPCLRSSQPAQPATGCCKPACCCALTSKHTSKQGALCQPNTSHHRANHRNRRPRGTIGRQERKTRRGPRVRLSETTMRE